MNAENLESGAGMSLEEMKTFIRNHFEQFVNRKNLDIADVKPATSSIMERMYRPVCRPDRQARNSM